MKKRDPQFNLIPYRFKFIGLALVILTVLFMIGVKEKLFEFLPEYKVVIITHGLNVLNLGLLFIALACEKDEDERTIQWKTKAFASGFVGAIILSIIWSMGGLVIEISKEQLSGQALALNILLIYLFTYYLQKFTGEEA